MFLIGHEMPVDTLVCFTCAECEQPRFGFAPKQGLNQHIFGINEIDNGLM